MNRKSPFKLTRDMNITILSGAGISAESGIPTFRSAGGLWADEELVKIATPHGFLRDPDKSWDFYGKRRANMASCNPNRAHLSLAQMEKAGYDIRVITQNIDRLHQRAGSIGVIELHGTVWELKCSDPMCSLEPFPNTDIPLKEATPRCPVCEAVLRPNVVFFEEMLDERNIHAANIRTRDSDLFLVIGTSGVVYPAAGFTQVAKMSGAYVVEFNTETTPLTSLCDETRLGPCGETLPEFFIEMTEGEIQFDFGE